MAQAGRKARAGSGLLWVGMLGLVGVGALLVLLSGGSLIGVVIGLGAVMAAVALVAGVVLILASMVREHGARASRRRQEPARRADH